MDNLTAGNPRAHAVRVYYEGSSTIYEGMPVCYNYLTTENWFGGSVSDGVVTTNTVTAEGSQNEGKYIRVVNPAVVSTSGTGTATAGVIADANLATTNLPGVGTYVSVSGTDMTDGVYKVTAVSTGVSITVDAGSADVTGTAVSVTVDNLLQFAGVVKKGGWCGKTGPRVLDIYVPNGAIVPVRCDVDTTVGKNILAITAASQELGACVTKSRPVAIAMETETDLDSTAGITLAKLDPNLFMFVYYNNTALQLGAATEYGRVNVTTSTTSLCWGPQFKFTNTGTGAGGMIGFRIEANSVGTAVAGNIYGLWSQAAFGTAGASASGEIAGVWSKAYVPADAGTISGAVTGIKISLGLGKAIGGDTCLMHFDVTGGAISADYWFIADTSTGEKHSCAYVDDTTCGADDKLGALKVKIGGTDMYINVYSDSSS